MKPSDHIENTSFLRRIGYCLLPVLVGAGAALVLLAVASGPARRAYAANLNFPACGLTIQGCIDSASPGDTILISAGDYTESLTLSKAVSLTGALSSTTILHALPNTRVLTVTGATVDSSVVISGLTFAGGHAVGGSCPAGCGGAILITATAQPLLTNLTITNNVAQVSGGGLYGNTGSPLVMSSLAFLNNTSQGSLGLDFFGSGGGGALTQGQLTLNGGLFQNNQCMLSCAGGGLLAIGDLVMSGTQFVSNIANHVAGGGAYVYANATLNGGLFEYNQCTGGTFCEGGGLLTLGNLALTDSQFLSNTSIGSGGGAISAGFITINGALFQNNQCTGDFICTGGGLFAGHNLAATNTLFLGNQAKMGAGLYVYGGNGRLVNVLFAANQASENGAALYLASAGSVVILHTTIASPTLDSGVAIAVVSGTVGITDTIIASYTTGISRTAGSVNEDYNLFFNVPVTTTGAVGGGGHNLTGDPLFVNPAGNDYHLGSGSLAIDAGTDAGVTTDFEGDPRPLGAGFDIGFDEARSPTANADAYSMPPNTVLLAAAPGVLANDSTVNAGPLTAQLATGPATGTLVLAPSGAFTYTPPINFTGQTTLVYRAFDGQFLSAPALVTITINAFKLYLPLVRR